MAVAVVVKRLAAAAVLAVARVVDKVVDRAALRATTEMTVMTAVASSSPRVRNPHAHRKARAAVVAPWATACRNNLRAMPMSRVNRVLRPVSPTPCAPAWT